MRKALAVLAIPILALLLGLPWYIGGQTEKRYRDLAGASQDGALRLVHFERGWLSSTARLELDSDGPLGGAVAAASPGAVNDAGAVPLTDHIAHGPFPITARAAEHRWRPALVAIETSFGDGQYLARYRLGMDGGVTGHARLDRAALSPPGAKELSVHGLEAAYNADGDPGRLDLELSADSFSLECPRARASADRLALELDYRAGSGDTRRFSARGSAREGKLALGGEGEELRWHDVSFRSGTSRDGAGMSVRLEASARELVGPNRAYGPAELRAGLGGVDAAALDRLRIAGARLAAQGLQRRALVIAMAGAVYAELPNLLAHRPRLALDGFRLETPEGPVTAEGHLTIDTGDPTVLNNPYLLQRAVTGVLELRAPAALGERMARLYLVHRPGTPPPAEASAWLQRQLERGLLTLEGSSYVLRVRYAADLMTVNGRPWPVPVEEPGARQSESQERLP